MAKELESIDVSNAPEFLNLAEEVRISNTPRVLRRASEDIAVVVPLPARRKRRGRRKTEADLAAFRAAARTWQDVDLDQFFKDLGGIETPHSPARCAMSYLIDTQWIAL